MATASEQCESPTSEIGTPDATCLGKAYQSCSPPALLTPETSAVLILDYQRHVMDGIHTTDLDLIELNGRALARATKTFDVPVVLSTVGRAPTGKTTSR